MFRQSLYVILDGKPRLVTLRNYTIEDTEALIDIQRDCFPPPFPSELWWNAEQIANHARIFPEGALCAEMDGVLIGSMTALIIQTDAYEKHLPWDKATDNGYIRTHHPDGDTLYVVDISVRPDYRKCGIGKVMMQAMYAVVVHLGLKRLLGGARMPGYGRAAAQYSIEQYVEGIMEGKWHDPVVSFLLRCGRTPVAIVPDYLEDEESRNNGLLMEWRNPFITNCRR
ncbi:GNAT family N-acetyltransferase [Paenibacillus sp. MER TA 81-3]|uniref:GNAT family N-acetyltransferase n=1 Tax=Paenibacillus sp. MER TA 81-3 TaxID=2939573 RepID=UPI00203AE79B|nr:GNAT family N-acetyltransferase [Paenibacillus sp. MER TA 81-3]MCM3337414.1 GNAT family N-acetyltransferase [Paenibacillus sp. MER TA 81-3]